jgi:NTP pyrophosphatase (non-canonical NTP hydrolase)
MSTRLEHRAISFFDYHRSGGFALSKPSALIAKLLEEVGEFAEAVMNEDTEEAAMEAGDVGLILVDILHMMGSDYLLSTGMGIAMDKLEKRHP